MKLKIFTLIAIIFMMSSTTFAAYGYWSNSQNTSTSEFSIGYGVQLNVPTEIKDSRHLVPAGSFYASNTEEFTTSYEIEYTLSLQDPLYDGTISDLIVHLENIIIGDIIFDVNTESSLFTVQIGTDITNINASETGEWNIQEIFNDTISTATILVVIEMNVNTAFEISDEVYQAIVGNTANFSINFDLVSQQ